MIRIVSILLTLVSYAVSDDCVRYTFEDNLSDSYGNGTVNDWESCSGLPVWVVGNYNNLNLTGQNEHSTSFISPQTIYSCAQSFDFRMNQGGTLELNIYTEKSPENDLFIYAGNINGNPVGYYDWLWAENYVDGWQTARINISGSNSFDGHIIFHGRASLNSTILVDSFRYIPPGMNEQECRLYDNETTTPASTTLASTTPELDKPDSTTSEPTTNQPTTPDPTRPTTPDPSESKTITFLMKMKMIFKL